MSKLHVVTKRVILKYIRGEILQNIEFYIHLEVQCTSTIETLLMIDAKLAWPTSITGWQGGV